MTVLTAPEVSTLPLSDSHNDVHADPKRVSFFALGCRTNQLETSALADEFSQHGWQVCRFDEPSELVVINTCTVTHGGDSESRRIIRKAKRNNPQATIAVTGCYAQVSPHEVAAIEGVNYVIGNNFKQDIYRITQQIPASAKPFVQVTDIEKSRVMMAATASGIERTRASLKIQDGCDYKCTYCIIPQARGPSRSVSIGDLKDQVWQLVDDGFKEIVLTGTNIGQYEDPSTQAELSVLLDNLVTVPGQFRLRLSSLDPFEVTPALIESMGKSDKLCPFVHLSMQSADDYILKRMGRRHRVNEVEAICERLVNELPGVGIGTDIIAGFPGETDEHFNTTLENLKRMPLSYFHIFAYSVRQQTAAAEFPGQVQEPIKKARSSELIALSRQKAADFSRGFQGQTRMVLVEDDGQRGTTDNFIHVRLEGPPQSPNQLIPVTIGQVDGDTTWATPQH